MKPLALLPLLSLALPSLLSPLSSIATTALAAPAPAPAPPVGDAGLFETDLEKREPGRGKFDWVKGYGGGGGGYGYSDYRKDWCPRRFYRSRYGKCVRNHGYGGCRWGYRRNKWGFCIRDHRDYDSDDDYDHDWRDDSWKPRTGWCPRGYKYDGSGHDGYPFDHNGHGPPSWVPSGWLYYGESIGWAPYKGWVSPPSWKPPVMFLKVVIKISWWTPSRDWCDYHSRPGKWNWWDYKIPSHWRFEPRRHYKERALDEGAEAS
ncbi:hypothetical protein JCM6882_004005 [Rhodosporidiobolus microsporus]